MHVNPTAEPHEEHGNMVRIRVEPDEELTSPRPGATVTANVHCGRLSLAVGQAARSLGMGRSEPVCSDFRLQIADCRFEALQIRNLASI